MNADAGNTPPRLKLKRRKTDPFIHAIRGKNKKKKEVEKYKESSGDARIDTVETTYQIVTLLAAAMLIGSIGGFAAWNLFWPQ